MSTNLIKFCAISLGSCDDKPFPVQQVEYEGKAADAMVIMPYGMHANVPPSYLGLLIQHAANAESRVVLPLSAAERIKPLAEGEVVVFNPVTGDKVHFKADGGIDVESSGDVNVAVGGDLNATVTGNINAVATGDVVATGANITATATVAASVIAPTINLTGNVIVSGTLAVTGALTQAGKDIGKNHNHSQGTDSSGDTQQNTGIVV